MENLVASFNHSMSLFADRMAAGTQPYHWYYNYGLCILMNVFYFVTIFTLKSYMRKREALKIKPILALYNVICVFLAGYCVWKTVQYSLIHGVKFACNSFDIKSTENVYLLEANRMFYLQKYWEFLDTFFFILRKSDRQVSFLHVFHHSSVTVVVLTHILFQIGGDFSWAVFMNSFVHVLMYSHYFLTSIGVSAPWKPYLTQLQLIQFVIILIQALIGFWTGCSEQMWFNVIIQFYMISMIVLFSMFYIQSYMAASPVQTKKRV